MLKTVGIIVLVVAALVGGLVALRRSTRAGVPGEDVLRRARQHELDLEAEEKSRKED